MRLFRKMEKGEDFLIFVIFCVLAMFVFTASLWMIDVSASAMQASAVTGIEAIMRSLFLQAEPNTIYHAGLVVSELTFFFVLVIAINLKWKEFRSKFKEK